MNAKQIIHQAKLNQWIGLFKEQADSGLTVLPSDNGVKRTTTLSIPTITGSTS